MNPSIVLHMNPETFSHKSQKVFYESFSPFKIISYTLSICETVSSMFNSYNMEDKIILYTIYEGS